MFASFGDLMFLDSYDRIWDLKHVIQIIVMRQKYMLYFIVVYIYPAGWPSFTVMLSYIHRECIYAIGFLVCFVWWFTWSHLRSKTRNSNNSDETKIHVIFYCCVYISCGLALVYSHALIYSSIYYIIPDFFFSLSECDDTWICLMCCIMFDVLQIFRYCALVANSLHIYIHLCKCPTQMPI